MRLTKAQWHLIIAALMERASTADDPDLSITLANRIVAQLSAEQDLDPLISTTLHAWLDDSTNGRTTIGLDHLRNLAHRLHDAFTAFRKE